jgi:hypothetical protein
MASLVVVSTSQSRDRRSPPDVGALVADLRRQHGKHATNALFELLLEDEALARAVAAFVVEKLAAAAPRRRVMPSAKVRAERQAAEKTAVRAIAAKVKELVALDMMVTLPDGTQKALRFCFGRELEQLGAAYQRIAERIGADVMVGECVTEAEAAALMRAP